MEAQLALGASKLQSIRVPQSWGAIVRVLLYSPNNISATPPSPHDSRKKPDVVARYLVRIVAVAVVLAEWPDGSRRTATSIGASAAAAADAAAASNTTSHWSPHWHTTATHWHRLRRLLLPWHGSHGLVHRRLVLKRGRLVLLVVVLLLLLLLLPRHRSHGLLHGRLKSEGLLRLLPRCLVLVGCLVLRKHGLRLRLLPWRRLERRLQLKRLLLLLKGGMDLRLHRLLLHRLLETKRCPIARAVVGRRSILMNRCHVAT